MPDIDLSNFRKQYPQYNEVPDQQLVNALYGKYYSNVPKKEFVSRFNKKFGKKEMSTLEGFLRSVAPSKESLALSFSGVPGAQSRMMTEVAGNVASTPSRALYSGIKSATSDKSFAEALADKTELGKLVLGEDANPFAEMALDIAGDPIAYIGGAYAKVRNIRKGVQAAATASNKAKTQRFLQSIDELSKTDPKAMHRIREDELIKAFTSPEATKQQEAIEFVESLKKAKLSRRADISTTVRGQGKLEPPQIDSGKLKTSKEVVLDKYGQTSEIKKLPSSEQINWAKTKTGKEFVRGTFKAIKDDIADTSTGIVANPYKHLEKFLKESKVSLTAGERQYVINSVRKVMSNKLSTKADKEQRVLSIIDDIAQGKMGKATKEGGSPIEQIVEMARGETEKIKNVTGPGYNVETMHQDLKEVLPKAIEDARGKFDELRGPKLTIETAVKKAEKRASTMSDQDVAKIYKGQWSNPEDLLAGRMYTNKKLVDLGDKINVMPQVEINKNAKDIVNEFKHNLDLFMKVRATGTKTARSLYHMRIPISDQHFQGLKKLQKSISNIDEKSGRVLKEILGDAERLPTMKDKVLFWWYNSMLSNPFTDLANITGNTSHFLWEAFTTAVRHPLSTPDIMKGIKRGSVKGWSEAKKIYTQESEMMSKFTGGVDKARYDVYPKTKLGKFFRSLLPTTRLSMEDAFASSVAREMKLALGAKKISRAEGLDVDDIYKTIDNIIKDPDFKVSQNGDAYRNLIDYAEKYAEYLTFRTPLKSSFGKGVQNTIWVKPIIPFMRVLANISKVGYKNSPVGFVKVFGKEFKGLNALERQDVVRRALAGTFLYTGIGTLMANNKIEVTGTGPENKRQRELWDKMGYKPNHIYWVGDDGVRTGISYQNINPFNVVLAVMGNWQDQYRFGTKLSGDDKDFMEKLSYALGGAAATMTDQSFMQGVKDFFDWIKYKDDDYLKDFFTKPFIPNIVGFPRNVREYIKGEKPRYEAEEWWNRLKRRVGLYEGLTPTYSAYGGQKETGYERFPFFVSRTKSTPTLNLLQEKNITISVPGKNTKINDREMTPEEYAQYVKESGKQIMRVIEDNRDRIKRMTAEDAQEWVNKIVRKERSLAKDKIKYKNNAYRESVLRDIINNF